MIARRQRGLPGSRRAAHRPPGVALANVALVALAALVLGACTANDRPTPTPEPTAVPILLPGNYLPPFARLQRIEGEKTHLHVDEVRYVPDQQLLLQCSYTFGVLDAKDPANMRYLAQNIKHAIPDDERDPGCIHLAADGNIVYTTHRGNISNPAFLSGWDIAAKDPTDETRSKPAQLPVLQEPGVSYEGVDVADGVIYVAIRDDGLGVYTRDAETNVMTRTGSLGDLGSTWGLRAQGDIVYLTDLAGFLVTVDVTDPSAPKLLGRVETGGVARGVEVEGDHAYVAAGSEGLVIVDVSDPASPTVVGRAPTPGSAIRVAYADGHAFVAAWNDTRAYDVSDPANPRFVGATRQTQQATYGANAGDLEVGRPPVTVRTLGVAAHEDIVFVGNWWVLYTYRLHPERAAPNIQIAEDANTIDFGPVAAGETVTVPLGVTNQGTAPLNLFNTWVASAPFAVAPKQVQVPPGETATLQVSYAAPAGGVLAPALGNLHIWSDDPEYPVRTSILAANREGLGVGKPLPETRMALLDGGEWASSDATGNVLVLAYFATF